MGTRNLNMIFSDGDYRVAKYCQWDGYPEGQGLSFLNFIRSLVKENRLEKFKQMVSKVQFLSEDEYNKMYVEIEKHPNASRNMGADMLSWIWDHNGETSFVNNLEFVNDSLFCEWAYLLDLDNNTFEVYKGFVKEKPSNERFISEETKPKDGYYPIKLAKKYSLDDLPTDKDFLEEFEGA